MKQVAVLFARADSIYKTLPDCDVWDIGRDARNWPGGCPVIAHPPCRAWGRLSHFAKPRADEMDLARWAVAQVRRWGGVLEHPNGSRLFAEQGMPRPGEGCDAHGGWTLGISQHWWGHRCEKLTLLYIVGVFGREVPDMPSLQLGRGTHVIAQDLRKRRRQDTSERVRPGDPEWRPSVSKAEREHTPPLLAAWLVELARRTSVQQERAA